MRGGAGSRKGGGGQERSGEIMYCRLINVKGGWVLNTYEADVNGALPCKVTQREGWEGGGEGGSEASEVERDEEIELNGKRDCGKQGDDKGHQHLQILVCPLHWNSKIIESIFWSLREALSISFTSKWPSSVLKVCWLQNKHQQTAPTSHLHVSLEDHMTVAMFPSKYCCTNFDMLNRNCLLAFTVYSSCPDIWESVCTLVCVWVGLNWVILVFLAYKRYHNNCTRRTFILTVCVQHQ